LHNSYIQIALLGDENGPSTSRPFMIRPMMPDRICSLVLQAHTCDPGMSQCGAKHMDALLSYIPAVVARRTATMIEAAAGHKRFPLSIFSHIGGAKASAAAVSLISHEPVKKLPP